MNIREIVHQNIAYYIKRSGYSQAEIARMLKVSKPTVTNWMKGVNSPNIELLKELCEILGITFTEMFEERTKENEALTADERQLVTDYREFNTEGKEKVRDYVADLKDNPKYKKRDAPVLDKQA